MSRTIGKSAQLRQAKQAVRTAYGPMFRLAAKARSYGLLSDDELVEFQALVKAGGEQKLGLVSDARDILARYLDRTAELKALLEAHGHAESETDVTVDRDANPHIDPAERSPVHGQQASSLVRPKARADEKRLAELSARELEQRGVRLIIATAMMNGATARAALIKANIPVTSASRRWAQRLAKEYRGVGKLHDGRQGRSGAPVTVLIPEMRDLIEVVWMEHRHATASGLLLAIKGHITMLQEKMLWGGDISGELLGNEVLAGIPIRLPSRESIRRTIKSFGKAKTMIRERGAAEHRRQMRPTANIEWTTHANQEWQADHTPLDVWVKLVIDGVWVRALAYLTVIIDVHSRAVVAAILSARAPDSFTTAHALRMAILPKEHEGWAARGLPDRLVLDNGSDFASKRIAAFGAALGVDLHYCRPHNPDEKPHIERFFRTLTKELLPILPGYKHAKDRGTQWSEERMSKLLTVPQLRETVLNWIHDEYHARPHTETDQRPIDRWVDSAARVSVPHPRDLDALLMYEETRRVSRGVVRLTPVGADRGLYWAPVLTQRNGELLLLRYNPDDLLSVYAYEPGSLRFVGELWNLRDTRAPYSDVEVRSAWKAQQVTDAARLAGLAERTERYYAATAAEDRARKKRRGEDMEEVRAIAKAGASPAETSERAHLEAEQHAQKAALLEDVQALRSALTASPAQGEPEAPVPEPTTHGEVDDLTAYLQALSA